MGQPLTLPPQKFHTYTPALCREVSLSPAPHPPTHTKSHMSWSILKATVFGDEIFFKTVFRFKIFNYSHVHVHVCAVVGDWRSEGDLQESALSCHGSSKSSGLALSHLAGPNFCLFLCFVCLLFESGCQCSSGWLCSQGCLFTSDSSCFYHFLSARITCTHTGYEGLRIQPRASRMLGKYSTH